MMMEVNLQLKQLLEPKPINEKYCNFKLLQGYINVMTAEKGTGKTQCIKSFVEGLGDHLRVLVVSPRRTLNRELTNTLGYKCYLDYKDKNILPDVTKLVCSPEHLHYLELDRPYDMVIIDECEQTLNHAVTSDTVRYTDLAATWICGFCNLAKTVVLADANILDGTKFLLETLEKSNLPKPKPTVLWKNLYKPRLVRKDVFEVVEKKEHLNAVYKEWADNLEHEKFIVVTDSIDETTSIHKKLLQYGVNESKILVLNSETTKIKETANTLATLNERAKHYDVIVYSPTMGTGISVDVENHHFVKGVAVMTGGSVNAYGASQMLARFRGLCRYVGFIGKDKKTGTPVDYDEALGIALANREPYDRQAAKNGLNLYDEFGRRKPPVFSDNLALRVQCINNISRDRFNTKFRAVLKDEGFEVTNYTGNIGRVKVPKPKDGCSQPRPEDKTTDIDLFDRAVRFSGCERRYFEIDDHTKLEQLYTKGVITDEVELNVCKHDYYTGALWILGVDVSAIEVGGEVYVRKRLDQITMEELDVLRTLYSKVFKGNLNKSDVVKAMRQIAKSVGLGVTVERPRVKGTNKQDREYYLDCSVIEEWLSGLT